MRPYIVVLVAVVLAACSLAGCKMGGASVGQRIPILQSDLNSSSRNNIYHDFSPTVADYTDLKSPSLTLNNRFPPPPPDYVLTVMSESMRQRVILQLLQLFRCQEWRTAAGPL